MNIIEATRTALTAQQFREQREVFIRRDYDGWYDDWYFYIPRSDEEVVELVAGGVRHQDLSLTHVDITATDWVVADKNPLTASEDDLSTA